MSLRFDHLGILSATDEQNTELATFFREVLGLEVDGEAGYAEVRTGATTIALHRGVPAGEVTPAGGILLQFASDDVRADIETIRDSGGAIAVEPFETDWGTTSAYVAGPHNVLVEVFQ